MTTPRINEMVEEFAERNDCIMCYGKNQKQLDRLRQALTQARQAGIDEVVEEINRRLAVQKKVLKSEYEGGYTHALEDIKRAIQK